MDAGHGASLRADDMHLLPDTWYHGQVVREVTGHDAADALAVLTERFATSTMLLSLALKGLLDNDMY